MSFCLSTLTTITVITSQTILLQWQHTVDKTTIQEEWHLIDNDLQLIESRMKGSAAGFDPPPKSQWQNGWYVTREILKRHTQVNLAMSDVNSQWKICTNNQCMTINNPVHENPSSITLHHCRQSPTLNEKFKSTETTKKHP